MAEMMASAVAQEVVSGAFSFMRKNHEEMASQSHLLERLKMAHLELKFSLERSREMPITEVYLLQRRRMIKLAFEECRDVLYKHTNEGAEPWVPPFSPSLPKRIKLAMKSFFSTEKGTLSISCVGRFEWFAEKADKFVRDVESGCSLARYRFSSPLVTQLLEGNRLKYRMVSGSQDMWLVIAPCCLEDYGTLASLLFEFKDVKTPMKYFNLRLMLRLSESTDIVGVSTKCLQSLELQFKPMADVASGELAQISTKVEFFRPEPADREIFVNLMTDGVRTYREEPLCCIGDGFQPSAKTTLSPELTERFPEQVGYMRFQCFIPAAEYNLRSSTVETNRNTIMAWPILQLSAEFLPHFLWKTEHAKVCTDEQTSRGQILGPLCCSDLSTMARAILNLAVLIFKLMPERTEFTMAWRASHGRAMFSVSKPTTEMGCAPKIGDTSKARRVSKRRRVVDVQTSD